MLYTLKRRFTANKFTFISIFIYFHVYVNFFMRERVKLEMIISQQPQVQSQQAPWILSLSSPELLIQVAQPKNRKQTMNI